MKNKDPVGAFVESFSRALLLVVKDAGYGIKMVLKNKLTAIGLLITILIAVFVYSVKNIILGLEQFLGVDMPVPIRYLMFWLLLLLPFWYLVCLGSIRSKRIEYFKNIFKGIEFKGKDKQYPLLINESEKDKRTTYKFKSNIPLSEWKKAKERLETGLDCSIRLMKEGVNKRTVELLTVSSDYKIPERIDWSDEFVDCGDGVIVLGESDLSQVSFDLNKTPHVLVAGETGSGKSVVLRAILWQLIFKSCKIYMIDFKGGVEFGIAYEKYGEVITTRERALDVLKELVKENAARLALFRKMEVKNLKQYNQKTGSNLCRIGVFIDEIAEMLDKKGVASADRAIYEQLEGELSTLSRLSRATGINLIIGVQRPDANILTGQIKNNIPVRICGRFADKTPSEIVLGNTAASDLPSIQGRFLYKMGNDMVEFQSYYFDDEKDLHQVDVAPGDMLIYSSHHTMQPAQITDLSDQLDFDYE